MYDGCQHKTKKKKYSKIQSWLAISFLRTYHEKWIVSIPHIIFWFIIFSSPIWFLFLSTYIISIYIFN